MAKSTGNHRLARFVRIRQVKGFASYDSGLEARAIPKASRDWDIRNQPADETLFPGGHDLDFRQRPWGPELGASAQRIGFTIPNKRLSDRVQTQGSPHSPGNISRMTQHG